MIMSNVRVRALSNVKVYQEYFRKCSTKHEPATATAATPTPTPNPNKIHSDMVGPVDPMSNLRRIVFRQRTDETPLERQLREKRLEVQDWNQTFWSNHNKTFFMEKGDYMKKNTSPDQQTLTPDEMSVFYKEFLDKNWCSHLEYNREWYRKNIRLLLLAIRVKLQRLTSRRLS